MLELLGIELFSLDAETPDGGTSEPQTRATPLSTTKDNSLRSTIRLEMDSAPRQQPGSAPGIGDPCFVRTHCDARLYESLPARRRCLRPREHPVSHRTLRCAAVDAQDAGGTLPSGATYVESHLEANWQSTPLM